MPRLPAPTRDRRPVLGALTGLLAFALLLTAGCSTTETTTEVAPNDRVATGPGVTDTTIRLGVLTDRSGPFALASKHIEAGRTLFWDKKNADGGVCGRKVEFVTRDHGYNVQRAVAAYTRMQPQVLAFAELLGSPELAALQSRLRADEALTMAASWSSQLLSNPYLVITGATYDIEAIDGISWLMHDRGLARGNTIGHIFLQGDYGENAAAGSRAAAKEYGLRLVEQMIKPTDSDLTDQITALRGAGATFVLLTTTPAQTASAVGAAAATGSHATFLASGPAYHPALLKTPARDALLENLLVTTPIAPFTSPASGPTRVRRAFMDRYPGQLPSISVDYGYAQAMVMAQILQAACDRGSLTRPGLLSAFHSLRHADTEGLVAPMDYSRTGKIPARQIDIARPDDMALGGLSEVQWAASDPLALTFQPNH